MKGKSDATTQQAGDYQKVLYVPKHEALTLVLIPQMKVLREVEYPEGLECFYAGVVQVQDSIFMTGGWKHDNSKAALRDQVVYQATTLSLKISLNHATEFVRKADFHVPREAHGIAAICSKTLYIAGGRNSSGELAKCEKYSIRDDRWSPAPPMSGPRRDSSLCCFSGRWMYVMGGLHELKEDKVVERLDALEEEEGWKVVKVQEELSVHNSIEALQVGPEKILICPCTGPSAFILHDVYTHDEKYVYQAEYTYGLSKLRIHSGWIYGVMSTWKNSIVKMPTCRLAWNICSDL